MFPATHPHLVVGPRDGPHNLDFSIFKSFVLREGMKVQFRAEAFNLTNSVQLGAPNTSWNPETTSTFGLVTSAGSTPRECSLRRALRSDMEQTVNPQHSARF